MYRHGDALVDLVLEERGRDALFRFYHETSGDPATFDMLERTAATLGPLAELRELWRARRSDPEP